jgi:predicted nucleic acid-binding protein
VNGAVAVDTSVWIPYLRSRRHAAVMDRLVEAGRLIVPTPVLLELYAGTASVADKRAVDAIRGAAQRLKTLVHPGEDDFCLAGQILSYQARRAGALRPRDHSHDLLIALVAARSAGALLTENVVDMRRWADAVRQRAHLRLVVSRPSG